MKTNVIVVAILLTGGRCLSQDGITLCHTPAAEKFALFASNKNFNANHPAPLPYTHVSAVGKMITFSTPDGKEANAFYLEGKQKTTNWVFVFQEWWGLNDHIKREAEKIYNDLGNVNVLALDMYDGKVATTSDAAGQYMQAFRQERGDAIVKGALAFSGSGARVATIGWCFGGGQSMQAALTLGSHAVGCVMYYGMPESDMNRLQNLNCDVLNIWGTQDHWINKDVIEKFKDDMQQAGKGLQVLPYDADHAFANPSNPGYNKEATEDAYQHVMEYLRAHIG